MIKIRLKDGPLRAALGKFVRSGRDGTVLMQKATEGVWLVIRRHFQAKAQKPNKRGFPSSGFWSQVYQSTKIGNVTSGSGEVIIGDHRYSPRFFARTITPGKSVSTKSGKPTVWLTIPAAEESYKAGTPRLFEYTHPGINLFFTPIDSSTGLLQGYTTEKRNRSHRAKKGEPKQHEGSRVFFVCKRSLTQPADPTWFPAESELQKGAVGEVEAYLRTLL